MSYRGIVRKCSVCQCCGSCDYEHELEMGQISGDYNPAFAGLMKKTTRQQDLEARKEWWGKLLTDIKRGGDTIDS